MSDDGDDLDGIDLERAREDFGEFSSFRAALQVVLLVSAAASGLAIVVDGSEVPAGEYASLVHWDPEDGEELNFRVAPDQAELTPTLVTEVDRSSIDLPRTGDEVSFEPLLAYLQPRVAKVTTMATQLMEMRLSLMRKYPRIVHEEPGLLSI